MVVLSAAILSKGGKPLVARQFVEMNRSRVEGLLAAFPKLLGAGQQHTFVETENVRYVYQPMEELYMVLVTTKTSNILEDLETLHLFSRIVPEYCRTLDEDEVVQHSFELLFAFDEVVSLGYNENVQINQIRTFTEMESHEEKIQEMIAKNKEMEAKEQAKLHIKQMELQRKENARKGKGFGPGMGSMGPSSAGPPSYGSAAISLTSSGGARDDGGYGRTSSSSSYTSTAAAKPATPVGRGMQLGSKKQSATDFLEAMKVEDGLDLGVDAVPTPDKAKASAATPVEKTESVHVVIEEKLVVVSNRDGGLENLEVKGEMFLRISDADKALIRVNLEGVDEKTYQFKTHPNVDKRMFSAEGKVGLKDPTRPFPVGQALGVLKWRYQTKDEMAIPLSINCWPTPANNGSCDVNIEYELEREDLLLDDVIISIPIPPGGGNPIVGNVEGDYQYNKQKRVLEWQLSQISAANKSGAMEFSVANSEPAGFFPLTVHFTSSTLLSRLRVSDVVAVKDGRPVIFSSSVGVVPEEFAVV